MSVIMIRSVILYILVVFAVRLMGKRQLAELQPSELVITILVSNIATLPLEDSDIPVLVGVTPILSLVCFEVIVSRLILRFPGLRKVISGSPKIIISHGKIDTQVMRELRFSVDDLMMALRSKDVFSPEEVQFAIVETAGSVSVLLKEDSGGSDPPHVVVSDSRIVPAAARSCGLSGESIIAILRRHGLTLEETFIMTSDSAGNGFIAPRCGESIVLKGEKQ